MKFILKQQRSPVCIEATKMGKTMHNLIFYLLYILVFGKHNKNICFATEEIDTYCKEGNVTCEQNTENRIRFESPLEDEIYYHKGIRLVLHKGILNLLDQNTAFCFTLYNISFCACCLA